VDDFALGILAAETGVAAALASERFDAPTIVHGVFLGMAIVVIGAVLGRTVFCDLGKPVHGKLAATFFVFGICGTAAHWVL
jgi:uncharacterized membrane protein YeaQ/YmgE (transglycosylase-associated protein family)